MDNIPIKTSQTEWSGVDNQNIPVPAQQWKDEPQGAPAPVTEPIKGESIKKEIWQTSQQAEGEHHTPEQG